MDNVNQIRRLAWRNARDDAEAGRMVGISASAFLYWRKLHGLKSKGGRGRPRKVRRA